MKAIKPEPWMEDALCAQTDPELWFPERGGNATAARRICAECPVARECLAYAIEGEEMGIWGGTSAKQRNQLREEQEARRCA